jgi:hypothetical protein
MKSESKVVAELWDLFRDFVPPARRLETAIAYLRVFEEFGFDEKDMEDIIDEDRYLARAHDDLYGADDEDDHIEDYEE